MQSRSGVGGLTGQGGDMGLEGRSSAGDSARYELVEGKLEARLMSRMELVAEAEPRSWMTPVTPVNPGDWLKPAEEMGPGNLTETSEEEDLQTGPELLTVRTGPAKKTKVWGTWVGSGSADHRFIRFMSAPGSRVDGSAVVESGSCSWTSPVSASG